MLEHILLGLLYGIIFFLVCVCQKRLGFLRSPLLSFFLGFGYTTSVCSSFLTWLTTLVIFALLINKIKWTENELGDGQKFGTETRLSGFAMGQLLGGLWICACLAYAAVF